RGDDVRGARAARSPEADRGGHPAAAVRARHRQGAHAQGDRREVQLVARADPPAPGAGAAQDAARASAQRSDVAGIGYSNFTVAEPSSVTAPFWLRAVSLTSAVRR